MLQAVVQHAFNPEETAARWMVQRLLIGTSNYFELAEGFSVVEINALQASARPLRNLTFGAGFDGNLVAIKKQIRDSTGHAIEQFNAVPPPTESFARRRARPGWQ